MKLMLKLMLVLVTMLGASPAFSWIVCGTGTIQLLLHSANDPARLFISTTVMNAPDSAYDISRRIVLGGPDERGIAGKLGMLQLALAMQYPLKIMAKGNSCLANPNDVEVWVCPPSSWTCNF